MTDDKKCSWKNYLYMHILKKYTQSITLKITSFCNVNTHIGVHTGSTCHMITVVSFDPVASLVPSLENLQNHTSLQCSVSIC